MDQLDVPVTPSRIASLFLDCGWPSNNAELGGVTEWLESQGVKDPIDLVGLELQDLEDVDQWTARV